MGFPQTRLTLIKRLTTSGSEQDWRAFHDDYWGAVCRFAIRWCNLSAEDAEDVAAETFKAILENNLLARWQDHRTAKLRTLICSVARNIMANQARKEGGRKRILKELAAQGDVPASLRSVESPSAEQNDLFYAAWVEDLLRRVVDGLLMELHREGNGDYFRVLYGRVCEQLTTSEIAKLLDIATTTAENYYKVAKKRLAGDLKAAVHRHVGRYCDAPDIAGEVDAEWHRLSDYLHKHGGLQNVLQADHHTLVLAVEWTPIFWVARP